MTTVRSICSGIARRAAGDLVAHALDARLDFRRRRWRGCAAWLKRFTTSSAGRRGRGCRARIPASRSPRGRLARPSAARERLCPLALDHCDRPQLSGLDVRHHGRLHQDPHLHPAAEKIVQRRAAALVRHVQELGAGHVPDQQPREVLRAVLPRGDVGELAGIGFRVVDKIPDGRIGSSGCTTITLW